MTRPSLSRLIVAVALAGACLAPCRAEAQSAMGAAQGPAHGGQSMAPGIESAPDTTLPAGQVLVSVLREGNQPLAGASVTLRETVQNVAEGNAKREQVLQTGADGIARFVGIDTSVRTIAHVSVRALGGEYAAEEFRPLSGAGHRVVVPVYEATADPSDAMVGMRGFIYVQLREGEFVFDVLFRVFSLGRKTWVPSGVHLDLPLGMQAFESPAPEGGAVADGPHGAKLVGSFPPGQKDVRMNFRLPAGERESEIFRLSLPPHVAEIRVITEYAPGMSLSVAGFEPVQQARGPEGTRVLVTRRALAPGEGALSSIAVELHGLPTVGPERWYAVALALLLAVAGLWFSLRPGRRSARLERADLHQARRLLLADLAALEKARAQDEVGPQTYERARRELLLALARLEEPPPAGLEPQTP
jgi:hypothetical protein